MRFSLRAATWSVLMYADRGGDSAQERNHGTLKFRQPVTVNENVTTYPLVAGTP